MRAPCLGHLDTNIHSTGEKRWGDETTIGCIYMQGYVLNIWAPVVRFDDGAIISSKTYYFILVWTIVGCKFSRS